MQMLARAVKNAYDGATVRQLAEGEWHLPFVETEDLLTIWRSTPHHMTLGEKMVFRNKEAIKLSVARCASTSFKTVEGFDMTLERAQSLHDKLVAMDPLHASPCEHQAQADYVYEFGHGGTMHGNLAEGWIQYRKTLAGECR